MFRCSQRLEVLKREGALEENTANTVRINGFAGSASPCDNLDPANLLHYWHIASATIGFGHSGLYGVSLGLSGGAGVRKEKK